MPTDDEWSALVRAVRKYAARRYGFRASGITIHGYSGTLPHHEPFPPTDTQESVPLPAPRPVRHEWASGGEPSHLSEFRAIYQPGMGRFNFSPTQALIVAQLWEAREDGTCEVSQDTLLRRAGSDSTRLSGLFKNHPAWGTLIIQGQIAAHYRLAPVPGPDDDPTEEFFEE